MRWEPGRRDRMALLVALGVDKVGSGLFLPLALVYATRVVGLTLGQAGVAVTVGTAAGLACPRWPDGSSTGSGRGPW